MSGPTGYCKKCGMKQAIMSDGPGNRTCRVCGEPWVESISDALQRVAESATHTFDAEVINATEVRGPEYGHPLDDFERAQILIQAVGGCPHAAIRHALGMICVKMSRLVSSPKHIDSVVDIAGYARTIAMIIDEEEKRDAG